jgi:phage baseplate assembly protein gpV
MKLFHLVLLAGWLVVASVPAARAQTEPEPLPDVILTAEAGPDRQVLVGEAISFDSSGTTMPPEETIQEVFWDFGDGVRTTGEQVTHSWARPGSYTVTMRVTSDGSSSEDTTKVQVFDRAVLLVADTSTPADQIELRRAEAASQGILIVVLRAHSDGPEAVVEDDLTQQMINAETEISRSDLIIVWTRGSSGVNVLSKVAQHLRQDPSQASRLRTKGIVIISETSLRVLAPTAQNVFDQLQPAYVLLTRPAALELLLRDPTTEAAKNTVLASPIEYRLLGAFSARTVSDISVTNFMSFGLSYLINHGVPVSSIVLILMLPVIATILSFTRQFVGIKAFGLITPTLTTLSFLVMGLRYGLIVFAAVLLAGTLTRLLLRGLRLLYLPRMALVMTSVSLSILILLGIGVTIDPAQILAFSVFPALILMILAEEFIAVQFKSGAKSAFTITAWTVALSILGYYIVSWELLRILLLSYPELILLTIPINILLGRWSGLRLTEYIRFRQLLRYGKPVQ